MIIQKVVWCVKFRVKKKERTTIDFVVNIMTKCEITDCNQVSLLDHDK